MSRYAQGPWEAKREDANHWCVYDATGMLVARHLTEANARLIAGAPNLIFAVEVQRNINDPEPWLAPGVRQAAAKNVGLGPHSTRAAITAQADVNVMAAIAACKGML